MKINYQTKLNACNQEIEKLKQEIHLLKDTYSKIIGTIATKDNILDDAHLGEIKLDHNSVIIGANKGFETLLGYNEGELLGLTFYDILAEGHDIHNSIFPLFKKTGVVKNIKWKMKTKHGKHILVTLCGRAVYEENGNFKMAVGLISDITELVTTSEALRIVEREKAIIMDVMTDCIIYYGTDQRVIWANKMVSIFSGIPIEELKGKKCFEICHRNDAFCHGCPLGEPINTTVPKFGEIRSRDNIFYIMTYPVKDDDGNQIGLVQVIRDITEQKMLEREILEISSKERIKIGNDIHDGLGQILTGISFISNALIKNLSESNNSNLPIAKNIETQSKNALQMMREILTGLCPVAEDPDGLMTALENLSTTVTSVYHIPCEYECCKNVQVHNYEISNNLYFIAREAVTNAIKHSECSKIKLCLTIINDNLLLKVEDNGKGISSDTPSSSGLGLRSMKYRSSVIGGNIDFTYEDGVGTTITVITNNF